jgi:CTP-dependent riboflavin kinase
MNESSERMEVHIFTRQFKVIGHLSIYPGVRLTDYMNESKSFVSVTNATVYGREGQVVFETSFLNLRRDEIEIIAPADQLKA